MRSQTQAPDLTLRTDILPGFNPEEVAELETKSMRVALINVEEARGYRSQYYLALFGRFDLTKDKDLQKDHAFQIARAEGVAEGAILGQRVNEFTRIHVLIDGLTTLNYDTEEAGKLNAEIADPYDDGQQRIQAHARLQGLIFNIPQEGMDKLLAASTRYFEGRHHQGSAIGLEFREQNGDGEWVKAEAAFADFYSQLETVRLEFNPEIEATGSVGDQVSLDQSQTVFLST